MKSIQLLSVIILISSGIASGQSKISKKEQLAVYKASIHDYVPEDIQKYEVLYVNWYYHEIIDRIRRAHYLSYRQNGIDTLQKPAPFRDTELEFHEKAKRRGDNFKDLKDVRQLQKKIPVKVINPKELNSFDSITYRYLLDIDFTSEKTSPEDVGFVITLEVFFVDRITGKKFKNIDDNRITYADLLE